MVVVAFFFHARILEECSTIYSPSALFFFFFFKVEIRSRTLIPLFSPGSVYSGSSSEKTVAECSVTSCVWALFLIVSYLVLSAQSATKDYVRAEHKLQSISTLSISQVIIHKSYFWAYLYSAGTQHGNLHPAGYPILFCRPAQEPVSATANRKKIGRGFGKNAGEWTGCVEISKKEIPGSKRSMYGYIL